MEYHKTKEGKKIKLTELKTDHLINIIAVHKRMAKEGLTFGSGGGSDPDSFYYDEDTFYDEEALDYLETKEYEKELERRNKLG